MTNELFRHLQQRLPGVQQGVRLAPYTYIKIGGPARYFLQAATADDLAQAVRTAVELKIPYRVIGGGANVLIHDRGFEGFVIRNITDDVEIEGTRVTVSSGYNLTRLAGLAATKGLAGLEFAFGIPGTVGGAIYGNAGAFDGEMKDVVVSADVLTANGVVVTLPREAFRFLYRHSALKDEYAVVLRAVIALRQGDRAAIQKLQHERLRYRKERQPLEKPSLGSVFKNIPLEEFPKALYARFGLPETASHGYVAAGLINDRLELRGMRIGDAQLSEKHGNFIVNLGHATSEQVVMLTSAIKQKVRTECSGLELHEEIQYLGM